MMTEDELKEIEERANAAKPGPWKWNHLDDRDRTCLEYGSDKFDVISHGYTSYGYIDYSSYLDIDKSDATFIEHAREDIPKLIAEVRRLQQPKGVSCPFCNDDDFDLIGLKYHLLVTCCDRFSKTEAI